MEFRSTTDTESVPPGVRSGAVNFVRGAGSTFFNISRNVNESCNLKYMTDLTEDENKNIKATDSLFLSNLPNHFWSAYIGWNISYWRYFMVVGLLMYTSEHWARWVFSDNKVAVLDTAENILLMLVSPCCWAILMVILFFCTEKKAHSVIVATMFMMIGFEFAFVGLNTTNIGVDPNSNPYRIPLPNVTAAIMLAARLFPAVSASLMFLSFVSILGLLILGSIKEIYPESRNEQQIQFYFGIVFNYFGVLLGFIGGANLFQTQTQIFLALLDHMHFKYDGEDALNTTFIETGIESPRSFGQIIFS
jgi:hypothetical protein